MNLTEIMKSMNYTKLIAAFAFSLILAIGVLAQQSRVKPAEGRIVGQLRNLCGVGIAKAVVRIKGGKVKRKTKSNVEGKFEFYLPAGNYEILVDKYGFKRYTMTVQVTPDSAASVNLDMEAGYSTDDPNEGKELPCPPPPNNSFNRTRN